jgi:hypothetical protein
MLFLAMIKVDLPENWLLHHKVIAYLITLLLIVNMVVGLFVQLVEFVYYYKHL